MMARALRHFDLAPQIEGEGQMQRFCGIWAKNCSEWLITMLACMKVRTSVVGFYDAMGNSAVDFIIEQTELGTIVCSKEYLKKVFIMKKEGLARHVKTLISMNGGVEAVREEAQACGIIVMDMNELIAEMENKKVALEATRSDDTYIFSYTSGTTGDSKGVKLNHRGILAVAECVLTKFPVQPDPCIISYLPYPHSFE
jgi:long-chain acyl-CoA synthetase